MNRGFSLLWTLGLGAGLMYFLDPDRGRRRRAMVRDRTVRLKNQTDDTLEKATRDIRNRMRGAMAEIAAQFRREGDMPDWIIEERVRAELGRVARYSSSISVSANQGRITLSGPILADEVERVVASVAAVRGVKEVDNQLEVHEKAGDIPGLQGNPLPREPRVDIMQENWSPATRVFMAVGGGALALYGLTRRGLIGTAAGLTGLGLAARGVTNIELKRLIGVGGGRRAIDLQKAININAPVERVYEYWKNYDNFPRFMSHVREVKEGGGGRSHWVVAGPAGTPIEWDAVITKQIPNQVLAWKTLPNETIQHSGIVRFDPNPDGSTRITVRMSYNPPAGALGHTVAALFGADPKRAMDEDLVRLKSLIEHGKTTARGEEVTAEEISGTHSER